MAAAPAASGKGDSLRHFASGNSCPNTGPMRAILVRILLVLAVVGILAIGILIGLNFWFGWDWERLAGDSWDWLAEQRG